MLIHLRKVCSVSQRLTSRKDSHLVEIVCGTFGKIGDKCMTSLMVGGHLLLLRGDDHALSLGAHDHLILGPFKILVGNRGCLHLAGVHRSLVDDVLELGARKSRGTRSDGLDVDVRGSLDLLGMMLQDSNATADIWEGDSNVTIEATRSRESLVQRLGEVGGGDENDAAVLFETIELGKKLVESLADVAGITLATLASYGVQLIDKDNRGSLGLGLSKELTDTLGADTHVYFLELTTGHEEEWDTGFARDRASQQSLPGTGRANEQDTFGHLSTEVVELSGVLEKINQFLQLLLCLVATVDVAETRLLVFWLGLASLAGAGAWLPGKDVQSLKNHRDKDQAEVCNQREPREKFDPAEEGGPEGFIDDDVDAAILGGLRDSDIAALVATGSSTGSHVQLFLGEATRMNAGGVGLAENAGLSVDSGERLLVGFVGLFVGGEASWRGVSAVKLWWDS